MHLLFLQHTGCRVHRDFQDLRDHQDHRVHQDQQDLKVHQDGQETLDLQVALEQQEVEDHQVWCQSCNNEIRNLFLCT